MEASPKHDTDGTQQRWSPAHVHEPLIGFGFPLGLNVGARKSQSIHKGCTKGRKGAGAAHRVTDISAAVTQLTTQEQPFQ